MITLRHIDRLFSDQKHPKLYRELTAGRPESGTPLASTLARAVPVAALGAIRLEELSQSNTPLHRRLINVVLTSQSSSGGWTDPATTALCTRALILANRADRAACGVANLKLSQQKDGSWSNDPTTTAYILLQLAEFDTFRKTVRFDDAAAYMIRSTPNLTPETQRLWLHAATRCRAHNATANLFTRSAA